jgi:hypothetical protein
MLAGCASPKSEQITVKEAQLAGRDAADTISLEWRPSSATHVSPGTTVELGLYAVADGPTPVQISTLELIFTWDFSELQLIGLNNSGAVPYMISSFRSPGGYCELNEAIPPADGDGQYDWAARPWDTILATTSGILLTRFQFTALGGTVLPSQIEMLKTVTRDQECKTLLTSGAIPDALGEVSVAFLSAVCSTDAQCPVSSFCDDDRQICAADCNGNAVPDDLEQTSDFNGDGQVNQADLLRLFACLTEPCGAASCDVPRYTDYCCVIVDGDQDGDVDLHDFARFAADFQ